MDRRSFIRSILSLAATSVLDVDKLLWLPGQKTIFLPSQSQIDFVAHTGRVVNYSAIIELEIRRVTALAPSLFDNDKRLYETLIHREIYARSPFYQEIKK